MEKYDVIVVGAGISGLSFAYYCAKAGLGVLVIEKQERTGGAFHSFRVDGGDNAFWIELGAHTCYNSYLNLIGIIEDLKIKGEMVRREKVPFKLLIGNDIKSIFSQLHFGELFFSMPRVMTLRKEGMSVSAYYRKIFGRRNYEEVLSPAFDAVISQSADDFPADVLFKKRQRRRDIMKSFTLQGGVQTVADSIASFPGIRVVKNSEVRSIDIEKDAFHVLTAGGESYSAEGLALAVYPHAAAELLKPAFPELSGCLARVGTEPVETVGVIAAKEKVPVGPLAGIIAVKDAFYSAVSRDTVRHEKYRGFSFHFRKGAGDRNAKIRRIGEVLRIGPRDIEYVVEKENRVPSLTVGHETIVADIDRLISGKRLFLIGNYFAGLAIEDCVSRSLSEFKRLSSLRGPA